MAYFVTGATGFIGRFLVANLLKRGEPVHVLVRKSSLKKLAAQREEWGVDDKQVIAVIGDLGKKNLGLADTDLRRLKGKVRYQPIGFELLPEKFTLTQLQRMYEKILEQAIDKRNFRKKILGMELLKELDEVQVDVAHRAARLYKFDEKKYRQLKDKGFNFEI